MYPQDKSSQKEFYCITDLPEQQQYKITRLLLLSQNNLGIRASWEKESLKFCVCSAKVLSIRCILVTGMTSKLTVKQKVYKEHLDQIVQYSSIWGFCFFPAEVLKTPYKDK